LVCTALRALSHKAFTFGASSDSEDSGMERK
jgi:hypothetical protein